MVRSEELIEKHIRYAVDRYKRKLRNTPWGRCIERHEVAYVDGVDQPFRFWREVAVYFVGEYLLEQLPEAEVGVCVDGNDSYLEISMDDLEEEKINTLLSNFFDKIGFEA
jgi:hypothetical protein